LSRDVDPIEVTIDWNDGSSEMVLVTPVGETRFRVEVDAKRSGDERARLW